MAATFRADAFFWARFTIAGQEAASATSCPRTLEFCWEDAAMRLSKVVWATLGAAALFVGRPALASEPGCGSDCGASCGGDACCGRDSALKHKMCKWGLTCHNDPAVMWYAPNPWYPCAFYFGPPYPATSYLPVSYGGGPAETAVAVRNQLAMMGVPPLAPKKEVLPPPGGGDKKPPKNDDKVPD
jgi:hypothetical protein